MIRIPHTRINDIRELLLESVKLDSLLILWDAELYEPLYPEASPLFT
jgi:hypothetical protein